MRTRGFTLVEILVVATVIAVLTAVGMASYGSVTRRSRDAKRKSDTEQMRSALEMYRADNGTYPNGCGTSASNVTCLSGQLVPDYMPAIPTDPKANQYRITVSAGYYGYCLTAYLESADETDTCSPDDTAKPSGYYSLGVRNP